MGSEGPFLHENVVHVWNELLEKTVEAGTMAKYRQMVELEKLIRMAELG